MLSSLKKGLSPRILCKAPLSLLPRFSKKRTPSNSKDFPPFSFPLYRANLKIHWLKRYDFVHLANQFQPKCSVSSVSLNLFKFIVFSRYDYFTSNRQTSPFSHAFKFTDLVAFNKSYMFVTFLKNDSTRAQISLHPLHLLEFRWIFQ